MVVQQLLLNAICLGKDFTFCSLVGINPDG